jgi:ChrR Cupin-like domain
MMSDSYCFCELAPLYALDMLSEAERRWVEQQVEECPEIAAELSDYQSAAMMLPYEAPPILLSGKLKTQLFERLGLEEPAPPPIPATPTVPAFLGVRSQDLKWKPHKTPGVTMAIMHIDRVERVMVGVLRAEAGVYYPMHRHAAVEELYMLSGDLICDNEVYGAGDYIRSHPGSAHAPHTTQGCMFYFRTSMDDEYSELELVNT